MTSAVSGHNDCSSSASWRKARIARNDAGEVPYVIVVSSYVFMGEDRVSRHKIFQYLRSSGCRFICRYIFATSAVSMYVWTRNRVIIANKLSWMIGPTIRQSLNEVPMAVRADASNTSFSFVVRLIYFITPW